MARVDSEERPTPDPQGTARLQSAWPDYSVWRAGGGSWMATRCHDLTEELRKDGRFARTLMAPDERGLEKQLTEQADLFARFADSGARP